MQTGENIDPAHNGLQRRNPNVAAVWEGIIQPPISSVWPSSMIVFPIMTSGTGTSVGALAPRRGPHTCSLVSSVALIFFTVGALAISAASGNNVFSNTPAEVKVRVSLVDVNGLQRLAAVENHRGDPVRIRLSKPGIDEGCVRLAGYQDRIDVEAAGVGVVDLKGERRRTRLGGLVGDDAEGETGKQRKERLDHGIARNGWVVAPL